MATLPKSMRAVVCATPGPVSVLKLQDVPLPVPQPGQVLIRILGFGINRAEMYTRQGLSPNVSFPRVVGIECIGTVAGYHSSTASPPVPIGQRVATCMGGLGRSLSGSYAEYTCVAQENIRRIPDTKNLRVAELASFPEMFQTTWGSLTSGLDVQKGESVLVRGATSSIGLCALQLLKKLGASRIGATTRNPSRKNMLHGAGADEVFIDNGSIADEVASSAGGVFDKVLELVGASVVRDSLKCVRPQGTVCISGMQGGEWLLNDFDVFAFRNRSRLTGYSGGPEDFLALPFEELVKDADEGKIKIPVREFKLEDIQQVHEILEAGGGGAKMVVVVAEE